MEVQTLHSKHIFLHCKTLKECLDRLDHYIKHYYYIYINVTIEQPEGYLDGIGILLKKINHSTNSSPKDPEPEPKDPEPKDPEPEPDLYFTQSGGG